MLFVNFTIASPAIGMTVAMGACVVFGKGGCLTLPGVNARGFLLGPVDLLVDVATFIVEISLFPSVNFGVPRRI